VVPVFKLDVPKRPNYLLTSITYRPVSTPLTLIHHHPVYPQSLPQKTWIQPVVESLLLYARALDLSLLTAVCQLSSHQAIPTQHDLASTHRLLNYVSSYRDHHKTIHPCSVALWACTDASFLSRPKSGSVAGCSVELEDPLIKPQKATDKGEKTNSPLFMSLACYNTTLMYHQPLSPTTPLSMPSASSYPWR
jgi:hypothetical protein